MVERAVAQRHFDALMAARLMRPTIARSRSTLVVPCSTIN
jgi:hypothetical protein